MTWGPRLLLQVPERTALAVTTTVGDVRIHDVTAPHVTITTTAGDLYLSDVTATVECRSPCRLHRAGKRVHGPKRITADAGSIEVSDSRGTLFTDTGGEQRLRRIDGNISVASSEGLIADRPHRHVHNPRPRVKVTQQPELSVLRITTECDRTSAQRKEESRIREAMIPYIVTSSDA